MGLITGLLTLPLAPIRGTMWIAERIAEQAAVEADEEAHIRQELARLEARYDLGEIGYNEYIRAEEPLLDRLMELTAGQHDDDARRRMDAPDEAEEA
jgi:hypothetical protein